MGRGRWVVVKFLENYPNKNSTNDISLPVRSDNGNKRKIKTTIFNAKTKITINRYSKMIPKTIPTMEAPIYEKNE
tara:strand:+ start:492 stop:716 length:225 start_codon:yes stop_codon:yes gene_type:complete